MFDAGMLIEDVFGSSMLGDKIEKKGKVFFRPGIGFCGEVEVTFNLPCVV